MKAAFLGLGLLALWVGCSEDTTGSSSSSAKSSGSATSGNSSAANASGGNNAGGTSGASGGTSVGGNGIGGGNCAGPSESCADGQICCYGLNCCAGQPVPPGQEYCAVDCPRSDRNIKRDFREVDEDEVLEQLCKLPISTWSYKSEDADIRHMGAMAQDFKARFGLGSSDKSFYTVDAHGVAFASIQALAARMKKLEKDNRELREDVERLERELAKSKGERADHAALAHGR